VDGSLLPNTAGTVGQKQLVSRANLRRELEEFILPLLAGLEDTVALDSTGHGWKSIFLDVGRFQRTFNSLPQELRSYCFDIKKVVEQRFADRYPGYRLSNGNVLWSKPGGEAQAWHADFDPDVANDLAEPPIVVFLCLSQQCRLDLAIRLVPLEDSVKERDIHGQEVLQQATLMEFHGGLPHRGCSYKSNNFRMHWYASPRSHIGLNPGTHTFIFDR
jgi:hypothetical protein